MRLGFFQSYVESYLLRDVTELGNIQKLQAYREFLRAAAALTAQQVNYATLAESVGISQPTAKSWLDLLAGLGIVYLLEPFSTNIRKRLARRPKLYFTYTGLASYLAGWPTSVTLMNGPMSSAFFENHVLLELLKLYRASSVEANFTYYRDQHGKEIDILLSIDRTVHSLEIKKSAKPNWRDTQKFDVLDTLSGAGMQRGNGGIVCLSQSVVPVSHRDTIIPIGAI